MCLEAPVVGCLVQAHTDDGIKHAVRHKDKEVPDSVHFKTE